VDVVVQGPSGGDVPDDQDAGPALEVASTHEGLRPATAEVFTDWIDGGAAYFRSWGADEDTARSLSLTMLTALEGAFVLARALRSPEPVYAAGVSVAAVTAAANLPGR